MGILRSDIVSYSSLEPTGSVLFDGTTDMLTIPSHSALAFGTADFSVECWVYFTSLTGQQTIVGDTYGETAGWYWYKRTDHKLGFYYTNSNYWAGETALEADTWYHLAAVRNNGVTSMYINGVHDKSSTDTTNCTVTQYYIADTAGSSSGEFFGYISNLRITRTAVYKQNFTSPKFELENVPGTLLLCCQSSSSTTEAAVSVPGTLTAQGDPTATSFAPDLKEDIIDTGVVFEDNTKFDTLSYMVPPGGTTIERSRGRAVFAGGYAGGPSPAGAATVTMTYAQIQSMGTSIDFGDLTVARWIPSSGASSTRGTFNGGATPTRNNTIDYVTIATTSNATNFGDLTTLRTYHAGFSNSTRAISGGGNDGSSNINTIDYITIASVGNATDFGDMLEAKSEIVGDCSPTRGLFMGGVVPSKTSTVDYITIATTGNEQAFGDLSAGTSSGAALSSNIRAIYAGGSRSTDYVNTIGYFTIATLGNETDFGDLITSRASVYAGTSNNIRGVIVAGFTPSPTFNLNSIEYITITTTGNANDFGDITASTRGVTATSDSHGGIS